MGGLGGGGNAACSKMIRKLSLAGTRDLAHPHEEVQAQPRTLNPKYGSPTFNKAPQIRILGPTLPLDQNPEMLD